MKKNLVEILVLIDEVKKIGHKKEFFRGGEVHPFKKCRQTLQIQQNFFLRGVGAGENTKILFISFNNIFY